MPRPRAHMRSVLAIAAALVLIAASCSSDVPEGLGDHGQAALYLRCSLSSPHGSADGEVALAVGTDELVVAQAGVTLVGRYSLSEDLGRFDFEARVDDGGMAVFGPGRLPIDPDRDSPGDQLIHHVAEVGGHVYELRCVTTTSSLADTATTVQDLLDICSPPPESALDPESAFVVEVRPNPVAASTEAVLIVSGTEGSDDASVSSFAEWQCWDGNGWVTVFLMQRSTDGEPSTEPIPPYTEVTVHGLESIPGEATIRIPDLAPGTYRIRDRMERRTANGWETVFGYVIVEVDH